MDQTNVSGTLLKIIQEFLAESGREHIVRHLSLKSDLTQDLGIDSLGRIELFLRVEKTLGVRLSDSLMTEAKTIQDVLAEIERAKPGLARQNHLEREAALEPIHLDLATSKTLGEVLFRYAQQTPNRPHIYLQEDERETIIRYGQLFDAAVKVAKGLHERGLKAGETVAIMLPTSSDFFYSFFGILLAGGIPVPIYPPFRPDQIEEYIKREAKILRNAEVRILITFDKAKLVSGILKAFIASLISIDTVQDLMSSNGSLPSVHIEATDPGLIQYTSGSTNVPKGVLLTHQNLLANIRAIGQGIEVKPTDMAVSWLPLYHDMGLIGSWLFSLYQGIPIAIMSPLSFLSRPERWLWAIHTHRATLSAAPNFAYELCVRKIDEEALEGLDLSSWRLAFNGAEAVSPKTLRNFIKKFSKYGFSEKTFFPVYGLAESTVGLTLPPLNRAPVIDKIARKPFELKRAEPLTNEEEGGLEFVACGSPIPDHEIRIVDENGQLLGERQVGLLQFRGPSSMQGYYRNPEATSAVYQNGWWNSGDLAYIANGEVFITGRKKDVIIKAGRNIYPEELEDITGQVKGIRKGCVVAFGATDPVLATEKVVIVAETAESNRAVRDRMIAEVIHKVVEITEIPPDHVVLVPPRIIPKTSSGKLRRSSCRDMYLKGELNKPQWSAGLQFVRLFGDWSTTRGAQLLKDATRILYTGYVWFLLALVIPITCLVISFTAPINGRRFCRVAAKGLFWLAGCPVIVKGRQHLFYQNNMVFVSNHASYTDVIALLTVLPLDTVFVAKKEVFQIPIIRSCLKKLGVLPVDRMDFAKSLHDAGEIENVVRSGMSALIFPEGTFTYATGLRPFKFGAFKIAADTKRPLCPIALKGTRSILRSGSSLLRPGMVYITVAEPIVPTGQDWHEVTRLHTYARTEIAEHCGEPIMDLIVAGVPHQSGLGTRGS